MARIMKHPLFEKGRMPRNLRSLKGAKKPAGAVAGGLLFPGRRAP